MIKKILFLSLMLFTFSFAITKENIKTEMTKKIDNVLVILKDKALKKDEKISKIVDMMDSIFDYKLMAKLSLGRAWKTLDNTQKDEFVNIFSKILKASYTDKLDLYTNQVVKVLGQKEPRKNRVVLVTQLASDTDTYEIDYKFYKKRNSDDWLIYDVNLVGVSIIQTYRNQFSAFLRDKTFKELLVHLKTKING